MKVLAISTNNTNFKTTKKTSKTNFRETVSGVANFTAGMALATALLFPQEIIALCKSSKKTINTEQATKAIQSLAKDTVEFSKKIVK